MKLIKVGMMLLISFCMIFQNTTGLTPNTLNATLVNSDVEIAITSGNQGNQFVAGAVYELLVSVSFSNTNDDLHITIQLPEGLSYVEYPNDQFSLLNAQIALESTPTLSEYNTEFGNLSYRVKDTVLDVQIPIKVRVDIESFYGEKVFDQADAIKARTYQGTSLLNEASQAIIAKGTLSLTAVTSSTENTIQIVEGSTEEITLPSLLLEYKVNNLQINPYFTDYQVVTYYPIGATVMSTSVFGEDADDYICESSATFGYVRHCFSYEDTNGRTPVVTVNIKLDQFGTGTYTPSDTNKITLTTYDGASITVNNTASLYQIEVVSLVSGPKRIELTTSNGYYSSISPDYEVAAPFYRITNDEMSTKNNQVITFTPDSNYLLSEVAFPVSKQRIQRIYYKTNLNNSSVEVPLNLIQSIGIKSAKINKQLLGLQENEYFTYVEGHIGNIERNYTSSPSITDVSEYNHLLGKLIPSASTGKVEIEIYQIDSGNVVPPTRSRETATVFRADNLVPTLRRQSNEIEINAGERATLNFKLDSPNQNYLSNSIGIVDPTLYLIVPPNMSYDLSTLHVSDSIESLEYDVIGPYTTSDGTNVIAIQVEGQAGGYFDGQLKAIEVKLDLITSEMANIDTDWSHLAFWQGDASDYGSYDSMPSPVQDVHGIGLDQSVIKYLMPVEGNQLIVHGETGIHVKQTLSTTKVLQPNETVTLKVDVQNNDTITQSFFHYDLAVPRKEAKLIPLFGDHEFSWDMQLVEAVHLKVYDINGVDVTSSRASAYTIEYSTQTLNQETLLALQFQSSFSQGITLIRVSTQDGVLAGEHVELSVKFKAPNEMIAGPNPLVSRYRSGLDLTNWMYNEPLQLEMGYRSLSGNVFKDNLFNGVVDEGDTPLVNKQIDLYKKIGSNYEFVRSTYSDHAGDYQFNDLEMGIYRINFNAILNTNQSITLQSPLQNGSKACFSQMCSGLIDDIDLSKQGNDLNAGVVDYNGEQLVADISESSVELLQSNVQQYYEKKVGATALRTIIPYIKAGKVTWQSSDETIFTYQDGAVVGHHEGQGTLTLTIIDYLGNQIQHSIPVTIISNEIPVLNTNEVTIERKSKFEFSSFFQGVDKEDGNIPLSIVDGKIDSTLVGDQKLEVSAKDSQGNSLNETVTVHVVDTKLEFKMDSYTMMQRTNISLEQLLERLNYQQEETLSMKVIQLPSGLLDYEEFIVEIRDLSDNVKTLILPVYAYDYYDVFTQQGVNITPLEIELADLSVDYLLQQEKLQVYIAAKSGPELVKSQFMVTNLPKDVGDYLVNVLTLNGMTLKIPLKVIDSIDHYEVKANPTIIEASELQQSIEQGTLDSMVIQKTEARAYYITKSGKKVPVEVYTDTSNLIK